MSVLVYGPYPPSPGHEATETLSLVRSLAGEHEVVVVSPMPSAAHHHLDAGSPLDALALSRLVAGHERVIVRLDAAGLLAGSDAARLMPGRLALSRALRKARRVELRLDRVPSSVSRRWVSAVVAPAAEVVVASDEERRALVEAGAASGRIRVEQPSGDDGRGRAADLPGWSGTTRESLQRDVRRRAAAVRAGREGAEPQHRSSVAAPLREIAPLGHAPIRSPKPGVAYVKRIVRKLVGWQLDPIIQHINALQQATIMAVERAGDQPKSTSSTASAARRNERSEA